MSASSPEYTLFLGCMIPLRHPQIELSARRSLGALGMVLSDSDGFSCCPEPWNVKGASLDDWLVLAARNLAVAERSGRDLLVLCNGCYSTLTEAGHLMSNGGEAAERVRGKLEALGLSYSGTRRTRHVVQALCDLGTDAVSASVTRPLSGLKVAVHHGCHLLRPHEILQVDDPFDPVLLEGLVEALGAEAVRYEGYTDCCGKATRDQDSSLRIASNKLAAMKSAGADCVVVVCPACFEQMDLGQVEIKRRLGEEHRLPVLHYCQLLALAQGGQPDSLGLGRHRVDVKPALQKMQG